jgi:hypothetical protein
MYRLASCLRQSLSSSCIRLSIASRSSFSLSACRFKMASSTTGRGRHCASPVQAQWGMPVAKCLRRQPRLPRRPYFPPVYPDRFRYPGRGLLPQKPAPRSVIRPNYAGLYLSFLGKSISYPATSFSADRFHFQRREGYHSAHPCRSK